MTDADWLASEEPAAMLEHLPGYDRKLRLFAVACCRRIWHLIDHADCRRAVEVAELFSDGLASRAELDAARDAAWDAAWGAARDAARDAARGAAWGAARGAAWGAARNAARNAARDAARGTERKAQADLIRDIFGNPFRPVTLPRGWLTTDVVLLAGRAYEHWEQKCDDRICQGRGRWADAAGDMDDCAKCQGTGTIDDGTLDPLTLAALADALEEAGCVGELLDAMRSPGPHYRGFWALDLLVGKG